MRMEWSPQASAFKITSADREEIESKVETLRLQQVALYVMRARKLEIPNSRFEEICRVRELRKQDKSNP